MYAKDRLRWGQKKRIDTLMKEASEWKIENVHSIALELYPAIMSKKQIIVKKQRNYSWKFVLKCSRINVEKGNKDNNRYQ